MPPLIEIIERHLAATGTKPTRFGRAVTGDPRLVFDLRRGRRPRAKLRERILRSIEGGEE